MTQQNTAKPVRTIRCGNIAASVWRNETKKDGRTVVRYSIRIHKRFRDQAGTYRNTPYYFVDDLPKLAALAEEVFRSITLKGGKEAEEAA